MLEAVGPPMQREVEATKRGGLSARLGPITTEVLSRCFPGYILFVRMGEMEGEEGDGEGEVRGSPQPASRRWPWTCAAQGPAAFGGYRPAASSAATPGERWMKVGGEAPPPRAHEAPQRIGRDGENGRSF